MAGRTTAKSKLPLWAQVVLFLLIVGGIYAQRTWFPQSPTNETRQSDISAEDGHKSLPRGKIYVADDIAYNVRIEDLDGEVVFQGDVSLAATLDRIEQGSKLSRYANDGSVFSNRERRLPRQTDGYYREWVHPTEGLGGPGPQRIITGKGGEFYYTPDHYEHFYPVERK